MTDKRRAVGLIRGFIMEEEEEERAVDTASRSPLDLIIFCFFPTTLTLNCELTCPGGTKSYRGPHRARETWPRKATFYPSRVRMLGCRGVYASSPLVILIDFEVTGGWASFEDSRNA